MRNAILAQTCVLALYATLANSSPVSLGKRRTMEVDDLPDAPLWDKRQIFSPRKTGVSTVTAPKTKSITSTTIVFATAVTTVTTVVVKTATVTVGAPAGGLTTTSGTWTALTPASKTTYTAGASPVPTSTSAAFLSSRLTWFHPGLGSCGQVDNDSSMIVAVSQDIWLNYPGANYWDPNGNPICNRKLQISFGGNTVVATVHDYCPGCTAWQLDLSPAVFQALTPSLDTGIMVGAVWAWLS